MMPPIPKPLAVAVCSDTCCKCHTRFAWYKSLRNLCWWCETNKTESNNATQERPKQ